MTAEHLRYVAMGAVTLTILGAIAYDVFLSPDAEQASEDFRTSEYLWEETTPPETPHPAQLGQELNGALGEAERFI